MDLSPDDDNFQGRLLHQAALWDNVELLQELLAAGADVNARDALQRTALHAAALAERSSCLLALCAAGADVDAVGSQDSGGKTALHIAAERGHLENVRALLTAGASLSPVDAAGDSALALAERRGHRHAAAALRDARDALERERLAAHAALRELVCRGEVQSLKARLQALGPEAGLIVNLTPGGANTLLYIAAESGHTSAVSALLAAGADGRAHPVTKYCPLYIACYRGHCETARLLLHAYPHAAQQETVEKWLPLHAACIGGHPALVTLLLEFPYPESMLSTYTDVSGQWRYRAAFDVNACDVSGQSALYVVSTLGNSALVDALLAHTVLCWKSDEDTPPPASPQPASPSRGGISLGIHAIVSRLTRAAKQDVDAETRVRPVRVDIGAPGDSCLAAATRGGHFLCAKRLLEAGADPDGPARCKPELSNTERSSRRRLRSSSALPGRSSTSPSPHRTPSATERELPWTPLAVAARNKHLQLLELLAAHGATDPHCAALRECARHGLENAVARLLAAKAFPDPDYKINKATVSETVFSKGREGDAALTYNALCPTTPVTVNWRELRCQLAKIRMQWIASAALLVNPRLGSAAAALHAVTRVDVSNNELRALPPELFTLLSLRYLNAAQNKIERLPSASEPFEEEASSSGKRGRRPPTKLRPAAYSAPVLQDLYLQDNRLDQLPPELFNLPSLVTLDVSNNKLRALPDALWTAPRLKELNASLNHLRELPHGQQVQTDGGSPSHLVSPSSSGSQLSASPSTGAINQFIFNQSVSKSSSRSPSMERSISEGPPGDEDNDDGICTLGNRAGNAVWTEAKRVHTWRGVVETTEVTSSTLPGSSLTTLNISHNQFTRIPPSLACRAPRLQRLSMAYNSLRSMSYVTSYPTSLRQLDLSHNEITCWPSLPQLDSIGSSLDGDPLACYCPAASSPRARPRSACGLGEQLLNAACPARRHLTLEGLRTLILSNNMLTRIQLTTDDDGYVSQKLRDDTNNEEDEWDAAGSSLKGRLMFPLLSMLDVSCNMLRGVPASIHALSNLAVLNISGNKDITELPPQMGLLSRLWNLNTSGCELQEPLRSMVQCGRFRSMDVIGYLKSVLQEARRYAAMKLMLVGLQGIGKTSLLECLRQESAITHRRKPTEHWAKRMGNKSSRRGGNVSTVGVDIGCWVYEKQRSNRGPVTFRTWDFGGQQEYYATHQYFLSRRSLYLVVWKVTDGRKGLAGALQWLRSIQARAPGSPVIMVATHYDQVPNCNLPENESPECLQRIIRSHIMGAADADKLGLPRILDSVEVSCSTRHNIRLLADIIYSIAFSVKPPGSKEPLLEQRVPATYLALEECVTQLASELKEPVLRHDDYKRLVTQYMQQKNHRMFRDAAELHQATMFLHENGVLLHYDDATLKELYFLKPQWLCDVLAHVVTIREINPFANNGIMKMDDLPHVFKASPQLARGDEAGSLGVSLLNKFELALCWDARSLLVPPLLPQHEPPLPQLPIRSRGWAGTRGAVRRVWPSPALSAHCEMRAHGTESPSLIHEHPAAISITARDSGRALRRLLLLSYVPCGFWARLCTRLLADDAVCDCAPPAYTLPLEVDVDDATAKALELSWGWKLWKTGLKLVCGPLTLASVRELPARCDELLAAGLPLDGDEDLHHPYSGVSFRIHQEGVWCDMDAQAQTCVELLLPAEVCVARRDDALPLAGYQSISLEPNPEVLAKLLALMSDHIDLLLEDWYPSLGTRFVHTSEGRCLITRVVPCPACLRETPEPQDHPHNVAQALRRLELGADAPRRIRLSEESRTSDGDSGVGAESNGSSLAGSVDRPPEPRAGRRVARAWTHERCILAACTNATLSCERHGVVRLSDIAPDALLLDVEESCRARWEEITRGRVVGRGAFGTVLAATWRGRAGALKALQPVAPEPRAPAHAHNAYKAGVSRWEREPAAAACRAYCALRQELAVLSALRHANVVPLMAACCAPLALLLPLAPLGSLDGVLREYRGCGARVGVRAARALALQVARALEYLHARRIVYRDLKSENVLVWSMPKPQEACGAETSPSPINVHVKLGDYGISRLAPPSGTKGFGGTEGFMAPEIMRYNGEEEYNEKVDCFSFGMLLYEIISLRQPFEGHEAVKEAVLDGARPSLSSRELQYPCNFLATMRQCWSGRPAPRPSAAALVSLCAAPEFTALHDGAHAQPAPGPAACHEVAAGGWEVWLGGDAERAHTLLSSPDHHFTHNYTITLPPENNDPVTVTAMCRVGARMWIGDSAGRVSVYSASTCALAWRVRVSEVVGGAASGVAAVCALHAVRRVALALECGRASTCALAWRVRVSEVVGGAASGVAAVCALHTVHRVALALECGRLFLVTSQRPEAEGSFVLTELGAATSLHCLTAAPRADGWEVWAGGSSLHVYSITEGGVSGADEIPDCSSVRLLSAAAQASCVLVYSEPGCCVHQYSVRTRRCTGKLDCSKLAPCSESLQSIALDDRLREDNCRVTAMCTMKGELYVGTAWGCVVVAEAATLRPITIFRPYETMVRAIVPLLPLNGADSGAMIATLGSGYRPLLHRFVPQAQASSNATSTSGSFCLLWRADDWQPD